MSNARTHRDRLMNKSIHAAVIAALTLGGVAVANGADEHDHDHDATTKPVVGRVANDDEKHDHDHDVDQHDHGPAEKSGGVTQEHGHDHGEGGHVDEVKLTPEAVRRHDIRVSPVAKHPLAASFVTPARVTYNAEAMAHVGSLVKGRAVEIKARLGDVVKKGDELLIVESPELGEA
ncbi:MAG TPA: hypothetical protein VMY34_06720, partial [Acidimicrobiales bacterium]|nr:hypothetical protein [Acidimicrobiales bacterium]